MAARLIERERNNCSALRAAGLRLVEIWVPDTRRIGFAEECKRQSRLLHIDMQEKDVLNFMNAVADTDVWQ